MEGGILKGILKMNNLSNTCSFMNISTKQEIVIQVKDGALVVKNNSGKNGNGFDKIMIEIGNVPKSKHCFMSNCKIIRHASLECKAISLIWSYSLSIATQ